MRSLANTTCAAKTLPWGTNSPDPCGGTFLGVTCNDEGRVTAINASHGGLSGYLTGADLSKLSSLSELDLSFNSLGDRDDPSGRDSLLQSTELLRHERSLQRRLRELLGQRHVVPGAREPIAGEEPAVGGNKLGLWEEQSPATQSSCCTTSLRPVTLRPSPLYGLLSDGSCSRTCPCKLVLRNVELAALPAELELARRSMPHELVRRLT
ncbi:hypothetical protein E2562_037124 [Oryza meyeriana var. granulata]|uniref:Leucine-rich repeat-containing N-terminal plant-type domain-containing protein n=1 Tax=Oryza meyeriana var. granulata TaxID=110450 RepID=A0A6G1F258_9ORYZ|nr:hypothetical protein E2562_037124 [Oryza meyeriana var. granulata]